MGKRCERCGKGRPNEKSNSFALFDYCAHCGRDLCDACMAKGCCGIVPAWSGEEKDDADQLADNGRNTGGKVY